MTTSDASGTIASDPQKYFAVSTPVPDLRPEPPSEAASSSSGVAVDRLFSRRDGRPSELESRRRTREFVRVLSECGSPVQAQQASRVAPVRALQLLEDPAVLAVLVAARVEAA